MKNFIVKVNIQAKSQEEAELARDELAASIQDAKDSNELKSSTNVEVGDPAEVGNERDLKIIALARAEYADDETEIDDEDVLVAEGDEGAFVQAWVFVPKDYTGYPSTTAQPADSEGGDLD